MITITGIRISWKAFPWVCFGFAGALVFLAMLFAGFNPVMLKVFMLIGLFHWGIGLYVHCSVFKHIQLVEGTWKPERFEKVFVRFCSIGARILLIFLAYCVVTRQAQGPVFWSSAALCYVLIMWWFAYSQKSQAIQQPAEN